MVINAAAVGNIPSKSANDSGPEIQMTDKALNMVHRGKSIVNQGIAIQYERRATNNNNQSRTPLNIKGGPRNMNMAKRLARDKGPDTNSKSAHPYLYHPVVVRGILGNDGN